MNKKVHFDADSVSITRRAMSIDILDDLDCDDEEKADSQTSYLSAASEKKNIQIEIPEMCRSPIHNAHCEPVDLDISPNSPCLSRRRQASVNDEHSDTSPSVRRRQMLTPETDYPGYIVDIGPPDNLPEESNKRIKPTIALLRNCTDRGIGHEASELKEQPSQFYQQLFYWTSYWPVFMLTILFINWVFFIWGIVWVIGWEKANVSLIGPVSPPQSTFPFITINYWPSCTSARSNSWRLMTAQFTHAGIQHIGGNTLAGLIYGSALECSHPYHWLVTILVYEMACIFGCLGHSYVWPFEGIIGCSTGIYGLIGCCIPHVVLNKDTLQPAMFYSIIGALLFQGTYDTVTYFYSYNPSVAYAGHCTGFFIGIFLGLAFGLLNNQFWKKVVGLFGLVAFLTLTISLIVHYVDAWPPKSLSYNPTFHDYERKSCCGALYGVTNSTFSLEQARKSYVCQDNNVYNWHKK